MTTLTTEQIAELESLASYPHEWDSTDTHEVGEALPALLAAAKRSLEYEAFFREHGSMLLNTLQQASFVHMRPAQRDLSALLERLK